MHLSTIPDFSIGNVEGNVISTRRAESIDNIENAFDLHVRGVEGSGVVYITDSSLHVVDVDYEGRGGSVYFYDGVKAIEIELNQGHNQVLINPICETWGFIVVDDVSPIFTSVLTVERIELIDIPDEPDFLNATGFGDVDVINTFDGNYELGTAQGSQSVSRMARELNLSPRLLYSLGREGSFIELTGLESGQYEFNVDITSSETRFNDSLYAYNGVDIIKIADLESGVIAQQIDVDMGQLTFIGLDDRSSRGDTEFLISDFELENPIICFDNVIID